MPTIDMASARHVDGSGTQLSFTPSDVLATQYFRWLDSNFNNALDTGEELQTFPSHYYQGSFNYNGNDFFAFQHVSNGRNWLFSSTTNNVADYPFGYRHGDFALDTSSVALCFAPGTLIATSEGQKTVESLRIGCCTHRNWKNSRCFVDRPSDCQQAVHRPVYATRSHPSGRIGEWPSAQRSDRHRRPWHGDRRAGDQCVGPGERRHD